MGRRSDDRRRRTKGRRSLIVGVRTTERDRSSTQDSALPVLRSRLLEERPGVVHGFTRKVAGMGAADGSVGYGSPRDRKDAWRMRQLWCAAIGLDAETLVTVHQVHGADVLVAKA